MTIPGRRIPVLCFVGGIGSGKSHLARLLAGEHGGLVIDADAIGHQLLEEADIKARLRELFGDNILDESGRVDRRAVAERVFGSEPPQRAARADLEALMHPRIRVQVEQKIAQAQADPAVEFIVLDAALSLETGWHDLCDAVIFVEVPESERVSRVARTRGWSAAELRERERSQWPLDLKRRHAGYIVENTDATGPPLVRLGQILAQLHTTYRA